MEFIKKNQALVSTLALVLGVASMSVAVFKSGATTLDRCTFQPNMPFEELKQIADAQGCSPEEIRIQRVSSVGLSLGGDTLNAISSDSGDQYDESSFTGSVLFNNSNNKTDMDRKFKYFNNESGLSVLTLGGTDGDTDGDTETPEAAMSAVNKFAKILKTKIASAESTTPSTVDTYAIITLPSDTGDDSKLVFARVTEKDNALNVVKLMELNSNGDLNAKESVNEYSF